MNAAVRDDTVHEQGKGYLVLRSRSSKSSPLLPTLTPPGMVDPHCYVTYETKMANPIHMVDWVGVGCVRYRVQRASKVASDKR